MNEEQISMANSHVFILSALYGLLRPSDLIRLYRLEMISKLPIGSHQTLYSYWKDKLTPALNHHLSQDPIPYVINLSSLEYFKAIDKTTLNPNIQIIDCTFKHQGRVIPVHSKRARGLMARHLIGSLCQGGTDILSHLKSFQSEGYAFDERASSDSSFVFNREQSLDEKNDKKTKRPRTT